MPFTISDSDQPSNKMETVIESFNADILAATADGMCNDEAMALIGSIGQCVLMTIAREDRLKAWDCIDRIMRRKIEAGAF